MSDKIETSDLPTTANGLREVARRYRESLSAPDSGNMFDLAYQWQDKPHRHVSDLCLRIEVAADALEALAGEVERLTKSEEGLLKTLGLERREKHAAQTERDRLKAALGAIAVKAGTSECGGNYVAAVSLIGDLEQMADAALRAAGDGR